MIKLDTVNGEEWPIRACKISSMHALIPVPIISVTLEHRCFRLSISNYARSDDSCNQVGVSSLVSSGSETIMRFFITVFT